MRKHLRFVLKINTVSGVSNHLLLAQLKFLYKIVRQSLLPYQPRPHSSENVMNIMFRRKPLTEQLLNSHLTKHRNNSVLQLVVMVD
ncbi:MAG: hypothetical protein LBG58_13880 [Planctomycetaceae bacterium]|nr:hypothetical protein [Planctomycetaceae bacterium]